MAIEGPLRELGIHDVFQLLDLSRKTGTLRVTSELRDDEGLVHFSKGRVVHASIRSQPTSLDQILIAAGRISEADAAAARTRAGEQASPAAMADALVETGAVSRRELERQVRAQIERGVFDLMSWREGFFSFEEVAAPDLPADSRMGVSTESLLMEGARRIDEWSRIADLVPNLQVIPAFAAAGDGHEAMLDLLPHEWEVLTIIDGERDLRSIAAALGRGEFEIAKIAYGLATTGVIVIQAPLRASQAVPVAPEEPEPVPGLDRARELMLRGDYAGALDAARAPGVVEGTEARLLAARALTRLERHAEAVEALRKAVHTDPLTPRVHLDLGFAAVRVGDFQTARASWEHFLRLSPSAAAAARARSALDTVQRLIHLLEAHDG